MLCRVARIGAKSGISRNANKSLTLGLPEMRSMSSFGTETDSIDASLASALSSFTEATELQLRDPALPLPAAFTLRSSREYTDAEDSVSQSLPFPPSALEWTTRHSFDSQPDEQGWDRKVTLRMKICNLNLSNSESQFVRAIAGLRYVRAADSVRISTSANETMVENKRQLYEQAVALVLEAKHLAAKHGEIDLAELGLCQEKSGQKSLKKRQRRQRQMRK